MQHTSDPNKNIKNGKEKKRTFLVDYFHISVAMVVLTIQLAPTIVHAKDP